MVYDTFEAAQQNCPEGQTVGGTYRDAECQEPVYFLHPIACDDDTLRRLAFEAKHGKPMTPYQEWAYTMARSLEVVS